MLLESLWKKSFHVNPLPALLEWEDEALHYFMSRDLLDEPVPPVEMIWKSRAAEKLVKKQQSDGSWIYPSKPVYQAGQNYALLETYRSLRMLVEMFGFNRLHPALMKAAEFVFGCQTSEGDIRGIIGSQYMPYYHGAILESLINAGYADDPRVKAGLDWLIGMRQEDGGWIVPAQGVPSRLRTPEFWRGEPVMPDRSLPHAHLATGMALRALAAHPDYRQRVEVIAAGNSLKVRFFQADRYNDRKAPAYWLKFQYPFWWTSLVTALDTLARLGFSRADPDIGSGVEWFYDHQDQDGLWPTGYGSGKNAEANRRWVGLAICRVLKKFV